jgi:hypothetical protein
MWDAPSDLASVERRILHKQTNKPLQKRQPARDSDSDSSQEQRTS